MAGARQAEEEEETEALLLALQPTAAEEVSVLDMATRHDAASAQRHGKAADVEGAVEERQEQLQQLLTTWMSKMETMQGRQLRLLECMLDRCGTGGPAGSSASGSAEATGARNWAESPAGGGAGTGGTREDPWLLHALAAAAPPAASPPALPGAIPEPPSAVASAAAGRAPQRQPPALPPPLPLPVGRGSSGSAGGQDGRGGARGEEEEEEEEDVVQAACAIAEAAELLDELEEEEEEAAAGRSRRSQKSGRARGQPPTSTASSGTSTTTAAVGSGSGGGAGGGSRGSAGPRAAEGLSAASSQGAAPAPITLAWCSAGEGGSGEGGGGGGDGGQRRSSSKDSRASSASSSRASSRGSRGSRGSGASSGAKCGKQQTCKKSAPARSLSRGLIVENSQHCKSDAADAAIAATGLTSGVHTRKRNDRDVSSVRFADQDDDDLDYYSDAIEKFKKRATVRAQHTLADLEMRTPSWLKIFVDSSYFSFVSLMMILSNAVFIGASAQYYLQSEIDRFMYQGPGYDFSLFILFENLFCVWFTFEFGARFIASPKDFVLSEDCKWNLFDFALVMSCLLDIFLRTVATPNLTYIRILRIVRMARILRIIRVMRFFRSLRLMVYSIIHSLLSLLWVFMLLLFAMYVFSIFILNSVTEHMEQKANAATCCRDEGPGAACCGSSEVRTMDTTLMDAFGTIPTALISLFQTICGGRSWFELYDPLHEANSFCGIVFVFYIFFVVFGVLNVVTGAFVDSMRQVSEKDHDHVVEAEMKRMDMLKRDIRRVFDEADGDQSGALSWEEFEAHLEDERVRAYFRTLEIDVSQARALFVLLDMEESDEVPIERFVEGCMRMRGDAKSIDVNMLLYENEKMLLKITSFIEYAEDKFENIEHKLEKVRSEAGSSSGRQSMMPGAAGGTGPGASTSARRRPSFSVQMAQRRPSMAASSRTEMGMMLFQAADRRDERESASDAVGAMDSVLPQATIQESRDGGGVDARASDSSLLHVPTIRSSVASSSGGASAAVATAAAAAAARVARVASDGGGDVAGGGGGGGGAGGRGGGGNRNSLLSFQSAPRLSTGSAWRRASQNSAALDVVRSPSAASSGGGSPTPPARPPESLVNKFLHPNNMRVISDPNHGQGDASAKKLWTRF